MRLLATLLIFLSVTPLLSCLTSPLYHGYRSVLPQFLFDGLVEDANRLADHEEALPLLKDYKRATHWYPLDGSVRPSTYHELAIERLLSLLEDDPNYSSIVGCEYWVQRVSGSGKLPISFHVDKDESVASLKHYLLHPIWSSVFYLTSHGGGTLITNQLSPHGNGYWPVQPEEGVWSFPEMNKFILFNGTLLHGVVGDESDQHGQAAPRVTFLVNFWRTVPEPPNCAKLEHKKVAGMKIFKKKQIKEMKKKIAADVANRELEAAPLDLFDLTRSSPSRAANGLASIVEPKAPGWPFYTFRMELPGRQEQLVTLPLLNHRDYQQSEIDVTGRNVFILWKNVKRIPIKKELELFKSREEKKNKASSKQEEEEEEDEEESKEEEKKPEPVKQKKASKQADREATTKPKATAAEKLAAARAAKEALKARMHTEL